jgi:hypothetical protein
MKSHLFECLAWPNGDPEIAQNLVCNQADIDDRIQQKFIANGEDEARLKLAEVGRGVCTACVSSGYELTEVMG